MRLVREKVSKGERQEEIRRLVASDRFELTAWRARFTAR